jgi:hypothetical protein
MLPDQQDNGMWLQGRTIDRKWHRTLAGNVWNCMRNRCKSGEKPAYLGCELSEEFKDFQKFAEWYVSQVGYGLGYELDKDFLAGGSKVYSPETCVLIPHSLNAFIKPVNPTKTDGLPVGVYLRRGSGTYRAIIGIDNRTQSLGSFQTVESAETAYKAAKRAETLRWIGRLESGEFVVDDRIITALRKMV